MCYLIAKRFTGHGCLAVQSEYGPQLASLVDYLSRRTEKQGIQILTISSKEAFSEYAPFTDVDTEQVFISAVLEMAN